MGPSRNLCRVLGGSFQTTHIKRYTPLASYAKFPVSRMDACLYLQTSHQVFVVKFKILQAQHRSNREAPFAPYWAFPLTQEVLTLLSRR